MKIVILSASFEAGGPNNVLYNMVEAYSHDRRDVEFVMMAISDTLKDSREEDYKVLGVKTICLHLNKRFDSIIRKKVIKRAILDEFPDVVHASGYRPEMAISFISLPGIKKVASIFCYSFEDFVMLYGKIIGSIMSYSTVFNYKNCIDMTIPCSEYIVGKYKKKFKKVPFNYKVAYTGVPEDVFVPLGENERAERRKELGIPENAIVYLFCAVLIPRKNPEMVVKTFADYHNNNTLLLIMGDGILREKCEAICNDPNVVRYLGYQPGSLNYLQVSDYLISSSYSEGFPTAVLEAMSTGVAPVLSNIEPHKEMLAGVTDPRLFNPDSEEDLLMLLRKETVSFDYRNYYKENFSSKVMYKKHLEIYKALID